MRSKALVCGSLFAEIAGSNSSVVLALCVVV